MKTGKSGLDLSLSLGHWHHRPSCLSRSVLVIRHSPVNREG